MIAGGEGANTGTGARATMTTAITTTTTMAIAAMIITRIGGAVMAIAKKVSDDQGPRPSIGGP
jgi:mannitol-specific phosphotransferase system IIBC component